MQIHEKLDAIHNRLALVEEKIDRSLLVRAEPDNPPTPTGGGPVHLADYLEFDPRVWEDGDSDGTGDGKHGFWNPMPGRFQAVEIRDRVNPGGISPDGSGGHGSAFTINYFVEGDGFVPARSLRVRPDWVQARLPKDTISIQIEDDGGRSQWVDVPNDVFRKAAGRPRL